MRRPLALQAAAAKEVVAPRPLGDDQLAFTRTALASQERCHPQERHVLGYQISST